MKSAVIIKCISVPTCTDHVKTSVALVPLNPYTLRGIDYWHQLKQTQDAYVGNAPQNSRNLLPLGDDRLNAVLLSTPKVEISSESEEPNTSNKGDLTPDGGPSAEKLDRIYNVLSHEVCDFASELGQL